MKTTIKIAIVAFALALTSTSCKKEKQLEPTPAPTIDNNSYVRIKYTNIGSTTSSATYGQIVLLNGSDTLFFKNFNEFYPTNYTFDTTINVNAAHIEASILMVSKLGIDEIDYSAYSSLFIYTDGVQKLGTYGDYIGVDTFIK